MKSNDEIITDQLTAEDWQIVLSADLVPLHRAYLEFFRNNSNKPMSRVDVCSTLADQGVIKLRKHRLYFQQISRNLKLVQVPYRMRALPKSIPGPGLFRLVKVALPEQRDDDVVTVRHLSTWARNSAHLVGNLNFGSHEPDGQENGRPPGRLTDERMPAFYCRENAMPHQGTDNIRVAKFVRQGKDLVLVHPAADKVVNIPKGGIPIRDIERGALIEALEMSDWVQKKAAKLLSISSSLINNKMKFHRIKRKFDDTPRQR